MANPDTPEIIAPKEVKDRGHLATLKLVIELQSRELTVLWPEGDNSPYDIVVDVGEGAFVRVQVKSSLKADARGRYGFVIGHGANHLKKYTEKMVDVIALYTFDKNDWYFLPVKKTYGYKNIHVAEGGKWEGYKNLWGAFNK